MSDLFESDFGTAFYRSRDPIKNFNLTVRLERVTSTNIIPQAQVEKQAGDNVEMQDVQRQTFGGQQDTEISTFKWQEKVLSKREIEFYNKPENCLTVLDRKYHDDAAKFLQKPNAKKRLFSYVDHDSYTKKDGSVPHMTTSPSERPTVMAEKMSNLRHRRGANKFKDVGRLSKLNVVDYEPSEDLKKQNHLLSTPVQTMYIMADLAIEGREPTDTDEFVLCTIKFDANGVISMRPDFNKGRKSYKIEAAGMGRDLFEYTIEHTSSQLTRMEQEKESKMLRELYNRHAEFLQACVGHDFEMPPTDSLRVLVYGEIDSAKNFENDHLYVSYFLDLPNGWYSTGGQNLSGVTQTCATKYVGKEDVANFSFPFDFELVYKKDTVLEKDDDRGFGWPLMYVEVSSLDSWQRHRNEGYGYISLPPNAGTFVQEVNCWRPMGRSSVSELRRFFIGGSPELEDPTYTAIPSTFESKTLSKFGFRTISTGTVTIKLNVMQQSQAFLQSQTSKKKVGTIIDRLGKSSAQVNVMNVLEAFQRAKQRMIFARENLKKEYIETLKALEVEEDALE